MPICRYLSTNLFGEILFGGKEHCNKLCLYYGFFNSGVILTPWYCLHNFFHGTRAGLNVTMFSVVSHMSASSENMRAHHVSSLNQLSNCTKFLVFIVATLNPSAWGHLNPSSYCDVGRLFYGVFKLWSKLQRQK